MAAPRDVPGGGVFSDLGLGGGDGSDNGPPADVGLALHVVEQQGTGGSAERTHQEVLHEVALWSDAIGSDSGSEWGSDSDTDSDREDNSGSSGGSRSHQTSRGATPAARSAPIKLSRFVQLPSRFQQDHDDLLQHSLTESRYRRTRRKARRLIRRLQRLTGAAADRLHGGVKDSLGALGGMHSRSNATGWCSRPMGSVMRMLQETKRLVLMQHGNAAMASAMKQTEKSGKTPRHDRGRSRFSLDFGQQQRAAALHCVPMLYDAWGDWTPYLAAENAQRRATDAASASGPRRPFVFSFGYGNAKTGIVQGSRNGSHSGGAQEGSSAAALGSAQLNPQLFDTIGEDLSLTVAEVCIGPMSLRSEGSSALLQPPRMQSEPTKEEDITAMPPPTDPPRPPPFQRQSSSGTLGSHWTESDLSEEEEDHRGSAAAAANADSGAAASGKAAEGVGEEAVRVRPPQLLLNSQPSESEAPQEHSSGSSGSSDSSSGGGSSSDSNSKQRPGEAGVGAKPAKEGKEMEGGSSDRNAKFKASAGRHSEDLGLSLVQSQFYVGLRGKVGFVTVRLLEVTSNEFLPLLGKGAVTGIYEHLEATQDSGAAAAANAAVFLSAARQAAASWVQLPQCSSGWWARRLYCAWSTDVLRVSGLGLHALTSRIRGVPFLHWPQRVHGISLGDVTLRYGASLVAPTMALAQSWESAIANLKKRRPWMSGLNGLLREALEAADKTSREGQNRRRQAVPLRPSKPSKSGGSTDASVLVTKINRCSFIVEGPGCGPDMLLLRNVNQLLQHLKDPLVDAADGGANASVGGAEAAASHIHFIDHRAVRVQQVGWHIQVITVAAKDVALRLEQARGTKAAIGSIHSLAVVDDPTIAKQEWNTSR